MISVELFIELLMEHNLWVSSQSIKADLLISGKPVTDSRLIQSGDAFICIKGLQSDGHNYINQARTADVALIVQEDDFKDDLPAIRVTDSRKSAALLSKLFYDNPTDKFKLIGVTGTNGKTTTSMLIWQALTAMGYKTGWIGTLGYRTSSDIIETKNTTPDIIELNSIFAQMVNAGCSYVVMEVSSHALALDRVYGLEFNLALFSNLSRDHLDFHKDMQDYFESKYLLFQNTLSSGGKCIINIDDEYGKIIISRNETQFRDQLISVSEAKADVTIVNHSSGLKGSEIELEIMDKTRLIINTELVGHFNIINLTMALAAIKAVIPAIENSELQLTASKLQSVRGRLERVQTDNGRAIFVDYAHSPDSLKNVLSTLKQIPHRRLLVVFGAGGDRDKGKRSEMLREVLNYADAAIITDDNPRTENPNRIIRDIIGDNDLWKPWWIIRDRKKAINSILCLARKDDIVLIAGKGHETYQEINGVRYPFDDVKTVEDFFHSPNESLDGELNLSIHPILLEKLFNSPIEIVDSNLLIDEFRYISTDSRTIQPESIYFAIKGEVFDGHDYVDNVLKDKSCCAVISNPVHNRETTFLNADTQQALGLLAKKYLLMFSPHKIALTGSTGKTTTKEYIANIFSTTGRVLKTLANENNIIGLTKTIFRIHPEDDTAVFELGTNHFGEIAALADICQPDVGIITNIGPSHLEFLKDEDGVYEEKSALLRRNLQARIIPGDDKRFSEFMAQSVSVGFTSSSSYRIENIKYNSSETEVTLNGHKWFIKQCVPFYVSNIAFAIASALEAGISEEDIQQGLLKPIDAKLRMEIRQINDRVIIFDCYNANPVSMQAAIEFWNSLNPDKPHIAILGDMLELGDKSSEFHKNIGNILSKATYADLFTIGDLSTYYHENKTTEGKSADTEKHFANVDEFIRQSLISTFPEDAIVLIKASHGIHLEKLIHVFEPKQSHNPGNDFIHNKE